MADSKISALPASTTPLAGTEVLPIVQSSATKQVSVANLTAGRAISATQLTLTTGNLIVANGQGIDFSATPGTGTSELFADYEEGTWTPVVTANSGTATSYGYSSSTYTKTGRQVTAVAVINPVGGTISSLTGDFTVAGLPFTALQKSVGYILNGANLTATQEAGLAIFPSGTTVYMMGGVTISVGNPATLQITYFV